MLSLSLVLAAGYVAGLTQFASWCEDAPQASEDGRIERGAALA